MGSGGGGVAEKALVTSLPDFWSDEDVLHFS